jgi:sporulation related protein
MSDSEHISGLGRIIIGAFGGLAAVTSKYIGQDHAYYLRMLDQGQQLKIDNLWLGYYIMTTILVFLGALVAWASYENHRLKLLAMAIAAPALITTYAGGSTASNKFAVNFISPAYAQVTTAEMSNRVTVGSALKIWFGIGKDEQLYRVIIGSFKSEDSAKAKADQLNKTYPDLKAYVGERRLFNDYYPVVVGEFATYPQAKALKDAVSEKTGVDDLYLSPRS